MYNDDEKREGDENINEATEEAVSATEINENVENEPATATVPSDNAAERLNGYLFADDELSPQNLSNEGNNKQSTFSVLKTAGLLILILAVAFTGAFSGMYWICNTALTADSDFLSALMLRVSGVKVNRVEVDYVSGEYRGDSVELAQKIMRSSIALTGYVYDDVTDTYTLSANGSGVILSSDGIAVTNQHVAFGLDRLYATDHNGKEYQCTVLSVDEKADLAIIKLDVDGDVFTPVRISDSSKSVMGQSIAVVGNPLGVGLSYSFGYVSHPDRDISNRGGNFIQIDATVNPGNSGGGLFDADGNLLGIVTAKAKGDNVDGIGYAIPSNRMLDVVSDLMQYGYVKGRPALGVTIATVTPSNWQIWSQAELKGMIADRKYGVFIISSKYTDDLKLGDRVVSVNGHVISENADITLVLDGCKVGDVLDIVLERPVKGDDGLITYESAKASLTLRERDWADELK